MENLEHRKATQRPRQGQSRRNLQHIDALPASWCSCPVVSGVSRRRAWGETGSRFESGAAPATV